MRVLKEAPKVELEAIILSYARRLSAPLTEPYITISYTPVHYLQRG